MTLLVLLREAPVAVVPVDSYAISAYPVSSTFIAAIRAPYTLVSRVDAYFNDALIYADLPFTDGSVAVNAGTGVARTLTLTVPDASLWDTLVPIGTELRPYRGVRYPGVAAPELVPLGVFGIDSQSLALAPAGAISLTAPDRWARIQRARFETPGKSVKGALVTSEISRLMTEALPGVGVTITATSTATVGALIWERDRDRAIHDLCASIGAEARFDWTGQIVIRDAPLLSAPPITWRVDASTTGVLLGGDRGRDRSVTYNVVVVSSTSIDGTAPFAPQVVEDDDPTSPTYVGDMGRVPYFLTSPVIQTAPQALVAGRTMLNKVKGYAASLSVEAAVNPALDRGDVFYVILPGASVERHLVESCTVPLTVGVSQQITTRTSRPEGDVPASE